MRKYWILKSEPLEFSIDDLKNLPNQTIDWFGIRNYQARNFMRDSMTIGDRAFFWHSSCENPGIYGITEIASLAYADKYQFDTNSKYYDSKSTILKPRWLCVDVRFIDKTRYISINELRSHNQLLSMQVLKRGNRLSISEVSSTHWDFICGIANNT